MQVHSPGILQKLDAFSKLRVAGGFTVILVRSGLPSAELQVDNFNPDNIIIENRNELLVVYPRPGGYYNFSVQVRLNYTELSSIEITGSTTVQCADGIKARHFTIQQSGSGAIDLSDIETDKLSIQAQGSGKIIVKGAANEERIRVHGSGSIDLSGLAAQNAVAELHGPGHLAVNVSRKLIARVNGPGTIINHFKN